MRNHDMKYKFIIIFIFTITNFTLICDIIYSQNDKAKNSPENTILRTDVEGNIMDGDTNDWDFDKIHYKYFLKFKEFYYRPYFTNEPHVNELPPPISWDVNWNTVTIMWPTEGEVDFKEFTIERKNAMDTVWEFVGVVNAEGYSNSTINYKFVDHSLDNGVYFYRLKLDNTKYLSYVQMPGQVIVPEKERFEFYPVYPNPAVDMFNVSFHLPKKDIVSLYFINGNDTTYILNHEPQERGFYKLTVDKKTLGFENEIKRLYISCKSCDKKKNFGDIQF